MANELNYFGKILETGLTVTAKVYDSSGTQIGADINCTEAGALSIYIGDMPTAPVGQYGVRFFNGLVILGQGFINWDGTKEIDFNLDATVSSRLANADYVEADNVSIAAIKAKTDTLVNTDLTGIALSSEIAALNDFDPTLDTVARVTLVDTTTANTDMRGTDGANTIAPDNASITSILADTNELQTNQGNFATATGFATPSNITDSEANIIAEVNVNESKIDIIDTNVDAIKVKTDTLVNTDLTGIALSSEIAALNDISALEVNSQVDLALADYDGPTKAEMDSSQAVIITEINANEVKIDAIETKAQADIRQTALITEHDTTQGNIAALNNFDPALDQVIVTTNNDKTGYTISGTITTLDALDTAQDLQHTATQALISALNDLSSAEVKTQADQALVDYDGPTKAELDAAQASIEAAIAGLNDLDATAIAQGVWNYLQSETTVSASMKEAIEITLKNAKLIPATI